MIKLIGRMLCALFGHKRRKRAASGDGPNDIMVCPRCLSTREVKPRAPKPT